MTSLRLWSPRSTAGSRREAGRARVTSWRSAEIRALAGEARLIDLAERFVGPAQPFRATLFDKSASANWLVAWHQDTALPMRAKVEAPGWGPWSTKGGILYAHAPASALARVVALRVSLDPSTDANGPLRVLPGTHGSACWTLRESSDWQRARTGQLHRRRRRRGRHAAARAARVVEVDERRPAAGAAHRVRGHDRFGPGLELARLEGEGTEGTEGTEKGLNRRNGATETNGEN